MSKTESEVTKMRPADIKIVDRVRKDLGDIDELARDIEDIGLLQPIVVTPDGTLIAGARRLQAWLRSNHARDPIPVHRVDLAAIVRGEFSENAMRKNFTVSEMVAMKRVIFPVVKAAAKLNQQMHGLTRPGQKSRLTTWPKIRSGEIFAKYCGLSRRSLEKAEAVIVAAERNPSRFSKIATEMDRTGNIDRSFNRLTSRLERLSSRDQAAAGTSIFDKHLITARMIGGVKASEVSRLARFFGYLAEHMGVPPNHAMTLREFIKPSLVRKALDYADQKSPTD
jgi:hypothetical protein